MMMMVMMMTMTMMMMTMTMTTMMMIIMMMTMMMMFDSSNSGRWFIRCFFPLDAFGPILLKSYLSFFTKYHCSPVFHTRSLDSFYMNTNLNGISMIHQGILLINLTEDFIHQMPGILTKRMHIST